MKADVLSGFDKIKVCIGYIYEDKEIDYFPSIIDSENIKPIYTSLAGWSKDVNKARKYNELEKPFKNYIEFIEKRVGVKIKLISLGPDREETVLLD